MLETMSREAALLAAADADLESLGDRLHDGALQELAGARYACDAVARGADPAAARDAVQHALVSLRRELWLLRPRGEHGLAAALSDLSEQLEAAGRPGLRLQADPVGPLPPSCAVMAYRLVQAVAGQTGQTGQTGKSGQTGQASQASQAGQAPLDVQLSGAGALHLDTPVDDRATWALRAAAVGAELHVTATSTLLQLPIAKDAL